MLLVKQDKTDLIFLMKKDKEELLDAMKRDKQEMLDTIKHDREQMPDRMQREKQGSSFHTEKSNVLRAIYMVGLTQLIAIISTLLLIVNFMIRR